MRTKTLRIMAITTGIIGSTLFNRFLEGGALFMSLILICLLISIFFTIRGVYNLEKKPELSKRMLALINDCGILAFIIGFFSAFLGLITGFDVLEATGDARPDIIAGGIKVALLSPLFGLFTFGISKIGIILIRLMHKY